MDTTDALQKNILDATLRVFDRKGLKFTMDDLAKELSISKKTIYTVYDDKEALFLAMVDYIFDSIKESEQMILTDPALGTIEKLQRILGVLPEGYQNIDLRKLYSLRDKYPKIYHKVELRLETGWEPTIQLIETGMAAVSYTHLDVYKRQIVNRIFHPGLDICSVIYLRNVRQHLIHGQTGNAFIFPIQQYHCKQ